MLLGSDRSKLGKRHGSTSIREFREQGYLSEAMINFLALLGWSLDDKTEIFSREDLIKNFSLERVSKTAAIFNHEKLKWMNGVYIRKLTPADFAQRCLPFLKEAFPESIPSMNYVRAVLPLVQERTKLLTEVPELTHYFFSDQLNYDVKLLISKDMTAASTRGALAVAKERLGKLPGFDAQTLEAMLRPLAEELKLKTGQLFGALRTAVSGETATPPLFQMMAVLGRERCLIRIQEAIDKLAAL
jgi:glutamyl-tRNA synthetase